MIIDGKELTEYSDTKTINIHIQGAVENVTSGGNISIVGDVKYIDSSSGDIKCGQVKGCVSTISGDIINKK